MDEARTTELRFRIPGADEHDRAAIRQTLVELPGVKAVRIDPNGGAVTVVTDPDVVSDDELLAAIGESGFGAERV